MSCGFGIGMVSDTVSRFARGSLALFRRGGSGIMEIFFNDLLAQLDALITDTYARTGNHTLYLVLIFSAERAS